MLCFTSLIFTFGGLGLLRNVIWTNNNRQLIFLLAYSVLLASIAAVFLTHQYAPPDNTEAHKTEPMEDMNNETAVPEATP
jgi:hypothetical protein